MNLEDMNEDKKTGRIWLDILILLMVAGLLGTYGIWQSTLNNWKIVSSETIFSRAFIRSDGNYVITYLNQESIYLSFLSVLFSFLGNKENVVSTINLILQLTGVFFFYLGSKRLFTSVFPIIITTISGVLCACFYPVIIDSSMHIIWCLSGILFWIGSFAFGSCSKNGIKRLFLGIFLGVFGYIDLAGIFLLMTFLLFTFITKNIPSKDKRIPFLYFIYFILGAVNGFFIMFYLWNNFIFDRIVFQYWLNDKLQFFTNHSELYQYISLGLLMLLSFIFYAVSRPAKTRDVPTVEKDVLEEALIKEVPVKENTIEAVTTVAQSASDATIENILETVTEQEFVKPIKFIENPLPLPKKHVKKEMNYAFEPTPDQMHYDLNNYRLDDDYDLKDN